MKELFFLVVVLYASYAVMAKEVSPKVQIYSRNPGLYGKPNVLICHVSGFHPPEIRIDLLKNGQEIADAKQTDLAFEENWHYHLTKHASFTPKEGEHYACRVTHVGKTTIHEWDADV
ncbi:beta-2-microglobulin-like [Poecilia latipinna]|uniref:Beta-2-microglobulin n=1 Tax=Poecilia formosa TaxID=48698 RepID=A0A087XVI9_POEFO|nr:PREDICTED: beta-2-microglobulin-like [Poecilia formosa]XP_014910684.1 PREDICTED: beta-2-microglobulin-like [Poecilia latipinna]